jgi:hypothetical protein
MDNLLGIDLRRPDGHGAAIGLSAMPCRYVQVGRFAQVWSPF